MERKGSIMKQYIIITLSILVGRYVDVPVWLNIFTGVSTLWVMTQLENLRET